MYSAESSHSSIVAEMPRLSSTGLRAWPSSRSSVKFCMLRAPTWKMSQYFVDQLDLADVHHLGDRASGSAASAASRSMLQPFFAEALEAVRRAARLEGAAAEDLRAGALAPPRPLACTCSSVSAEHGPAMTITSSPPIRTSSMRDDRVLRLEGAAGAACTARRCAAPRGRRRASRSAPGSTLCAPTTPSTVRVTPDDRCTSIPSSTRRAITAQSAPRWPVLSLLRPCHLLSDCRHGPMRCCHSRGPDSRSARRASSMMRSKIRTIASGVERARQVRADCLTCASTCFSRSGW